MAAGRVTMTDIAEVAGVSVASVSNALNNRPGVSEDLRRRIVAIASGLGFRPNVLASELRTGLSTYIGLLLVEPANPFYGDLSVGVIDAASDAGMSVVVSHVGASGEKVEEMALSHIDRRVRGLLFTSLMTFDGPTLHTLKRIGTPFVQLVRSVPSFDADWVGIDDFAAGVELGAHVASTGRRRVALVVGQEASTAAWNRSAGLRSGLVGAGATVINDGGAHLWGLPTRQSGYERAMALLSAPERPEAILCGNDALASGVIDACMELGLRVPEDVALSGFDDMSYSHVGPFQLTTVHVPCEKIGRIGTQFLLERADGYDGPARRSMQPYEIRVRATTAT
jgi:LacI family transcriptional regulator